MRFRRRIGLLAVTGAALLVLASVALAGIAHTRTSPHRAGRHSHIHVSFIAPAAAGTFGTYTRYYEIGATEGSGSARTCTADVIHTVGSAQAGERVYVTLKPGERRWCRGTFHGSITEVQTPACVGPKMACPFTAGPVVDPLSRQIGTFSFRVR